MGPQNTVEAVKGRLELASGLGTEDNTHSMNKAWTLGGTERMYFDHPTSRLVLGSVEIDTTSSDVEQVRLELIVPPALAEALIQLALAYEEPKTEACEPLVIEEACRPFAPPTREPGPADEAEALEETLEGDGLPAEVMAQDLGELT